MRKLVYFLGGMFVLDGLWGILSPRSGFAIYRDYLKPYLPSFYDKMVKDYAKLSDTSIRYLSVWTLLSGLFLLILAGNLRSPSLERRAEAV